MKKVFCVFAHREDHIVAGWPIMQNNTIEKHVFICTNDYKNIVKESIDKCAKKVYHHYFQNGFMHIHMKNIEYDILKKRLIKLVGKINPDYIVTHNPWGEYGHVDHRFLFSFIYNTFQSKQIIISNIISKSSYYPVLKNIPLEYKHLYDTLLCNTIMDNSFYSFHANIYMNKDAWTNNINLNIPYYQNNVGLFILNKQKYDRC